MLYLPEKPWSHSLNSMSVVSVVKEEFDEELLSSAKPVEKDKERPMEKPCSLLKELESGRSSFSTRSLVNVVSELEFVSLAVI